MTQSRTRPDPVYKSAKLRIGKLLTSLEAEAQPAATAASPDAAVLTSLPPHLVHRLRVCTKRLRALLQLYRPVASKATIKAVERPIKALADSWSGQRDAVAQYETLCHLVEVFQQSNDQDMQPLMRCFEVRLQQVAVKAEPLEPIAALERIQQLWKDSLKGKKAPDYESGVEFAYRKARKLAYEAESSDDDEVYHWCRKWTKYYLYQLQMIVAEPRPRDKALIKQLKQLGELLGGFHDRCVLEQALNGLLAKKQDEALEQAALLMLSWLMEQKRVDKSQCQGLFESVFARPHNPFKLARLS
ncbi:MAG: CHAD domain-containing protein [Ketobacter sp.]|nr:CHAD domain-containing protein [Ketobacter sp.]